MFLLTLTPLMLVMAAASVAGKPLFGLLLIGACRFALTGVYQATGTTGVEQAAGWLGVPLAIFALYGGLALLREESHQRMVLPLGRRGRARTSIEGRFGHQVDQTELEPGGCDASCELWLLFLKWSKFRPTQAGSRRCARRWPWVFRTRTSAVAVARRLPHADGRRADAPPGPAHRP